MKIGFRFAPDGLLRQVAVENPQLPGSDEVVKTVQDVLFEIVDLVVAKSFVDLSSSSTSMSLDCRGFLGPDQCPGGVPGCTYEQALGSPGGKPLKEVDPSQHFLEIRKNGEACTSGDTCSTPEQFGSADVGFCSRYGYDDAWRPQRTGDQLVHGHCSSSSLTSTSSSNSKLLQDQWSRYYLGCLSPLNTQGTRSHVAVKINVNS